MKQVFLDDEAHCTTIGNVRELTHRPFRLRLWESVVRLISPLL